ncbi:MAG: hypothetical protein ACPL0B_00480 [Anaerolineales bacterium]
MRIIGNILAGILIFFGVLFIWGAFSPQGSTGWIIIGVITVAIGLVIVWFVNRKSASTTSANQNVTIKIDLPANINLENLQCKNCGGNLTMDNIEMVAGAPVVHCPYCNTTYQLTEDPKW